MEEKIIINIIGNLTPEVGVTEKYIVVKEDDPFEVEPVTLGSDWGSEKIEWSVFVIDAGKLRCIEYLEKKGKTVDYTFSEISSEWEEVRILVEAYGTHKYINIKIQPASKPKITSITLLNEKREEPTRKFAYGDSIIARIDCVGMELRPIVVTLWENDGDKHKLNTKNIKIETQKIFVKRGFADVKFYLNPMHADLANSKAGKGESDEGQFHEYYVTAEIEGKESSRRATLDTHVANPDYVKKKLIVKNEISANPIMDKINSIAMVDMSPQSWWPFNEENKKGVCPNCDKPITISELKQIFTQADEVTLIKASEAYSKYMTEVGMNTCWNKAHFFAQAVVESGLKLIVKDGENFNWYYESLIQTFKAFQTAEGKEKAGLWGRPVKLPKHPGVTDENQKNIANWAYSPNCDKGKELGNIQSNDGWNFRGQGLIQLTGRKAYNYANKFTKKEGIDILENSSIVSTDISIAVLTSMAFFNLKKINDIANGISDTKPISKQVGKEVDNSYTKKQKAFDDFTSIIFKTSICKFSKNVVIEFGPGANETIVSEKSLNILREVGEKTKNYLIHITSTARDPYNQARVMYINIVNKGIQEQRNAYMAPGQKVLDAYENAKAKGKNKEGIIEEMEAKILEVGPTQVSKHCGDPTVKNVFDVSYDLLSNPIDFKTEITRKVSKLLDENRCYHIEINQ